MNITPIRLYVEAQLGALSLREKAAARLEQLRTEEDGFEIPASMIIMVGLIALGIALVAALTDFGQQAIGKLQLP